MRVEICAPESIDLPKASRLDGKNIVGDVAIIVQAAATFNTNSCWQRARRRIAKQLQEGGIPNVTRRLVVRVVEFEIAAAIADDEDKFVAFDHHARDAFGFHLRIKRRHLARLRLWV